MLRDHRPAGLGQATVGFFGKLPCNGDFIARRVNGAFRDVWDEWLQRSLAQSQRVLGGRWLDCYLTSPLWRFFLCDGVAGAASYAGVLVPSVDRVGRHFPLTVVVELPPELAPLAFARAAQSWFVTIERLCTDALQEQDLRLDAFDAAIMASAAELANADQIASPEAFNGAASQWRWSIRSAADLEAAFGRALLPTAQKALRPMTLWWTDGSQLVGPSALLVRGLPNQDSFAAFLAGGWDDGHWHGEVAPLAAPEVVHVDVQFDTVSAGATDTGKVRSQNEDSFVLNDGNRLWAVADGMGGHRDGDVASLMVVDALNAIEPVASLDALLESMSTALSRVNADLRRAALGVGGGRGASGSTVVALAVRGARFAVCWAGDSRLYLYRHGTLAQITRDHVESPTLADGAGSLLALLQRSMEITRAVGGHDTLELDHIVDTVAAGDRFLLCSDGLHGVVDDSAIVAALQLPTAREACDALIARALNAGAPDNVTVVIVDVRARTSGRLAVARESAATARPSSRRGLRPHTSTRDPVRAAPNTHD